MSAASTGALPVPSQPGERSAGGPTGSDAGTAVGAAAAAAVAPVRKVSGGRARPAPRPVPERSCEFDHLTLDALREYRKELAAEEGRVSYWRRIIQARLDVVRAVATGGQAVDNLRDVLSDVRVASTRTALLDVVGDDDIPPLPDLGPLWTREPGSDAAANLRLESALDDAEQQLSEYRNALHRRLEAATNELIARYREQPALCLVALPQERMGRVGVRA